MPLAPSGSELNRSTRKTDKFFRMKRYHFEVESRLAHLQFWVVASSSLEAVEKANSSFGDALESQSLWLGMEPGQAFFSLNEKFAVSESHIVSEDEPPPVPEKSLAALAARGYDNSGINIPKWREEMLPARRRVG